MDVDENDLKTRYTYYNDYINIHDDSLFGAIVTLLL
jgi:hypothetical protein